MNGVEQVVGDKKLSKGRKTVTPKVIRREWAAGKGIAVSDTCAKTHESETVIC